MPFLFSASNKTLINVLTKLACIMYEIQSMWKCESHWQMQESMGKQKCDKQ